MASFGCDWYKWATHYYVNVIIYIAPGNGMASGSSRKLQVDMNPVVKSIASISTDLPFLNLTLFLPKTSISGIICNKSNTKMQYKKQ